ADDHGFPVAVAAHHEGVGETSARLDLDDDGHAAVDRVLDLAHGAIHLRGLAALGPRQAADLVGGHPLLVFLLTQEEELFDACGLSQVVVYSAEGFADADGRPGPA